MENLHKLLEEKKRLENDIENINKRNLEETYKKITSDSEYAFWFFMKNHIMILALMQSDQKMYEEGYDINGGYKNQHFQFQDIVLCGPDKSYDLNTTVEISDTGIFAIILTEENCIDDSYSGYFKREINEAFLPILKYYNESNFAKIIHNRCLKCKFFVICKLKKCVYNSQGIIGKDVETQTRIQEVK